MVFFQNDACLSMQKKVQLHLLFVCLSAKRTLVCFSINTLMSTSLKLEIKKKSELMNHRILWFIGVIVWYGVEFHHKYMNLIYKFLNPRCRSFEWSYLNIWFYFEIICCWIYIWSCRTEPVLIIVFDSFNTTVGYLPKLLLLVNWWII